MVMGSFAGGLAGSVVGQAVIEVVVDNSGINKSLTATQKMVAGLAVAGLGSATVAMLSYETALAGVAKTTGLTGQPLAALGQEFRSLAKRDIPMSATALANIGATAAQLGVKAENLVVFTETMAKLGTATNIVGEQGAQDLARFINVMGDTTDNVGQIGSAIVDLGNNSATTEAEILALALRTAAAGRQMGLTTGDVLGLSAAASSLGLSAESGGTALSRVMLDIYANAQKGSQALTLHAQVAGMTAEAYHRMVQESPMEALTAFIGGLGTAEERGINVITMLDEMSFGNVRIRDTLLRLSGAQGLMNEAVGRGNDAYRENTALQQEFEVFAETGANQLRILVNQMVDLGLTAGTILLPALKAVVGTLGLVLQGFDALPESIKFTVMGFLALIALGKPLNLLFARTMTGLMQVGTALKYVTAFGPGAVTLLGPMGIAGALVAVGVATDLILQKTTGHGLIDWLFRDPRTADAAAAAVARVNAALEVTGALDTDSRIRETREEIVALAAAYRDAKAANDERNAGGAAYSESRGMKEARESIKQLMKSLDEAGVPILRLQQLVLGLDADLQKSAREGISYYDTRLKALTSTKGDLSEAQILELHQLHEVTDATRGAAGSASEYQRALRDLNMEVIRATVLSNMYAAEATGDVNQMIEAAERARADISRVLLIQSGEDSLWQGFIDSANPNKSGVYDWRRAESGVATVGTAADDAAKKLKELEAAGKRAADELAAAWDKMRSDALGNLDTLGRAITTGLQREYEAQLKLTLKGITEDRDLRRQAHEERLGQIARERDAAIAVIDDQIAALRQQGNDRRMEDLKAQLRLAWDPREKKRIQDQIDDLLRQATIADLEAVKRDLQDEAQVKTDARQREYDAEVKEFDRLEQAARDNYADMTKAWKLEAQARELITSGNVAEITRLIGDGVDEWASLWQTFGESVTDGPLTDIERKVRDVFALMGQVGGAAGGVGAAAVNPNAAKIAALNAQGIALKGQHAPEFVLADVRSKITNLGGFPSFKAGGALYEPALVLAGDRPGTFEHITGDDQLRRSIRDEFDRRDSMPPQFTAYLVMPDGALVPVVTRVVRDATQQAVGGRGGYGR